MIGSTLSYCNRFTPCAPIITADFNFDINVGGKVIVRSLALIYRGYEVTIVEAYNSRYAVVSRLVLSGSPYECAL